MNRREQLKKYVNDNADELIVQGVVMLVTIGTYTALCALGGYRMCRPQGYEGDRLVVQTISGRILRAPLP